MRKYLNFCLLIALLSVFTVVSAQRDGNHPREASASVTISSGNQPFWMFIDDVLQNENPTSSIRVSGIPEGQHYLRVELDNPDHLTVGQYMNLQGNRNALWIENQRNLYGLSEDKRFTKPETEVFFKYAQQNMPPRGHGDPKYNEDRQSQRHDTPHNRGGNDFKGNRPPQQDPARRPEQSPEQRPEQSPEQTPEQRAKNIPGNAAMPGKDFQQALNLIKNESFENGKLTIAKQVLDNNMLSINQIQQICNLFEIERTRLDFVQAAYYNCTEKEKYYQLNSLFEFSSTKMEFDKFLQSLK